MMEASRVFMRFVLVVVRLGRRAVVRRGVGRSGGWSGKGTGAVTLRRPSVRRGSPSPSVVAVTLLVPVTGVGVGAGREVIVFKLAAGWEGLGTRELR